VRYFRGGRFDEAIPLFQSARNDPRNRASAGMYLGRCFFRKGYHSQAISTLREAIQHYEHSDDELAKNMQYWLGRAQEEAKQVEEARKTYGALLQLDYNFRDVRDRLDGLPAEA
jgi:tetratricopeptide (TPR) repeat protein